MGVEEKLADAWANNWRAAATAAACLHACSHHRRRRHCRGRRHHHDTAASTATAAATTTVDRHHPTTLKVSAPSMGMFDFLNAPPKDDSWKVRCGAIDWPALALALRLRPRHTHHVLVFKRFAGDGVATSGGGRGCHATLHDAEATPLQTNPHSNPTRPAATPQDEQMAAQKAILDARKANQGFISDEEEQAIRERRTKIAEEVRRTRRTRRPRRARPALSIEATLLVPCAVPICH